MISEAISNETGKITIRLPVTLVTRLNEVVPARQHDQFVQRAIEELLALEEQSQALAESAGAWAGDGYADLDSPAAVERWIKVLRNQVGRA